MIEALYFFTTTECKKPHHERKAFYRIDRPASQCIPRRGETVRLHIFDPNTGEKKSGSGPVIDVQWYFSTSNEQLPVVDIIFRKDK
jgi:hypothetical protein